MRHAFIRDVPLAPGWCVAASARSIRPLVQGLYHGRSARGTSGDTDIGAADGRFISGTCYSIALTGTLFGGTASSIFYLLYRRVPEVRRLYGYREVGRWIQHYGAVKTTWTEKFEERAGSRGLSTGIQRCNLRVKELPRVHPGIIHYLLPQTLFAKITDLAMPCRRSMIKSSAGRWAS